MTATIVSRSNHDVNERRSRRGRRLRRLLRSGLPDLGRPLERGLDVRKDVLGPHMAMELGFAHQRRRLRQGTAEEQCPARRTQRVGKILNRAQPGSVERRHVAKAQDDDRREVLDLGSLR